MASIEIDTSVIPSRVNEALDPTNSNPIHTPAVAGQTSMNVGVHCLLDLIPGGSLTDSGGIAWSISGGDPIKDYAISSLVGTPDAPP